MKRAIIATVIAGVLVSALPASAHTARKINTWKRQGVCYIQNKRAVAVRVRVVWSNGTWYRTKLGRRGSWNDTASVFCSSLPKHVHII
jgi:hypothetical protein